MKTSSDNLTFQELRDISVLRCEESYFPINSWPLTNWALAMIGEAGEVCNVIKKINRSENRYEELADELADVVIYADLLAARANINLGEAIRRKFNATSAKIGSSYTL